MQGKKPYLWISLALLLIYSLAGFLLAPKLLQERLQQLLAENYDSELRIETTSINPFSLALKIDGIELYSPTEDALLRVESIGINFQLSSLFRRTWTFRELSIVRPEFFVVREEDSALNFSYLFKPNTDDVSVVRSESEQNPELVPVLLQQFLITDAVIHLRDHAPLKMVESSLGPINFTIAGLTTVAGKVAQEDLNIVFEDDSLINLRGELQLNPLRLSGQASIVGSYFSLLSNYIRDDTGIDINRGELDISLEYFVALAPDEPLQIEIKRFNLDLNDAVVSTYAEASADSNDIDEEVLSLPQVKIINGSMTWPQRIVTLESIVVDNPEVNLFRDESGVFSLSKIPLLNQSAAESSSLTSSNSQSTQVGVEPWSFSIDGFVLQHLKASLHDSSVDAENALGLDDLNFQINNISTLPDEPFDASLYAELSSGGTFEFGGQGKVLPVPSVELAVEADNLALKVLQPYMRKFVELDINSGELNLAGTVISSQQEPLAFIGDAEIADLALYDIEAGELLASWDALRADSISVSMAEAKLAVAELALNKPYVNIVVTSDGRLNLGFNSASVAAPLPENDSSLAASSQLPSTTEPLAITIAQVTISEGAADFADQALPRPFAIAVADLNGSIAAMSSTSSEASQVALEGRIDEYALLRIGGAITPFAPMQNSNILLNIENVNIPNFSGYTIVFAGREISNGRVDVELAYNVNDSQLDGENQILLRELELGERIDHPDAASLPLDLAVMLLKGSDGNIELDLPVSGDLSDPEFSYGNVVFDTFSNIVLDLVASPFTILANLVGFEGNELDYIEFLAGRADLGPPQQEKVGKLTEALLLRPELILELSGVVDPEVDGLAMRKEKLEGLVDARVQALGSSAEEDAVQQRMAVLQDLYREYQGSSDLVTLEQLQQDYMAPADETEVGSVERLDELAYLNGLTEVLIAEQVLVSNELEQLANLRAINIQTEMLTRADSLQARIILIESQTADVGADDGIRMRVKIARK